MSWLDRIFTKAVERPTSITADTTDVEATAWSIDVVNTLTNDYATLAKPYADNPIVRAAIEAMKRNATKAVIQVGTYDDNGGFEAEDHPLAEIWKNPGPGETDGSIIEHVYESLIGDCGDGNAYVQWVSDQDDSTGGTVREMQPIPPLWMQRPLMGRGISEIIQYNISGTDFGRPYIYSVPAQRMMHVKTGRSVDSMALGRSMLNSVKPELALIRIGSLYETTILTRAGVPAWVVTLLGLSAQMTDRTQMAVLQSDLARGFSGSKVGRGAIMKGDMKIDTFGFSPEQLSVTGMLEMAVCRVCGVLGWAPMSLKQPDAGKTYSNLIEANKASWRDSVLPFLEMLAASLTKAIQAMPFAYGDMISPPRPDLCVRFDVSQIEELAADRAMLVDHATKLKAAGIASLNESRAIVELSEIEGDPSADAVGPQEQPEDDPKDKKPGDAEDAG